MRAKASTEIAVAVAALAVLRPASAFAEPRIALTLRDEPVAGQADADRQRRSLLELVRRTAVDHGVDPRLVDAVIRTESAYRAEAVSPKGAVGLMQLMPETARRYGATDPFDPVQNVRGGTAYLRELVAEFGVVLALAAYNAGEGAGRRHGGTSASAITSQRTRPCSICRCSAYPHGPAS